MADAGFFKGTSTDQDRRFSDKETKLLKSMKFPSSFDKKVDMRKVNLQVIRPWITNKVIELVGFEDEVVVEYAMGLLEDESKPTPDPKKMQINLTGFLTTSTPTFMTALWTLLLEAQDSPAGIPRSFVEEKKAEMRNANKGDEKVLEERERRRLDEIRERERGQRDRDGGFSGRGRGRGRGRGGWEESRKGRDSGWGGRGGRQPRQSRTPPHRRERSPAYSRSPPPRQRRASYTPIRSSRSPSRSLTRSPPPPPPRRRRSPSMTPTPPRGRATPPYRGPRDTRDTSPYPGPRDTPPHRGSRDRPSHRGGRERPRDSPPPRGPRDTPPHRLRRVRARSYSPPTRERARAHSLSASRSRSRTRSPLPRRRDRDRVRDRARSPTPEMRRSRSPPRRRRDGEREHGRRRSSPRRRRVRSPSRSPFSEVTERPVKRMRRSPSIVSNESGRDRGSGGSKRLIDRMEVDVERDRSAGRKSRWDERDNDRGTSSRQDLTKVENELREKALRQKVVRTRDQRDSTTEECHRDH